MMTKVYGKIEHYSTSGFKAKKGLKIGLAADMLKNGFAKI
jgi:hypothetical protein